MRQPTRPLGVTLLSLFFFAGAFLAAIAALSLACPGGFLAPMWRLNPRGHQGLAATGGWGVLLMAAAAVACATAGIGLRRARPWGLKVAMIVLLVQLGGDVLNVVTGSEPRALVGIPVIIGLLFYLGRRSQIIARTSGS